MLTNIVVFRQLNPLYLSSTYANLQARVPCFLNRDANKHDVKARDVSDMIHSQGTDFERPVGYDSIMVECTSTWKIFKVHSFETQA